MHRPIQYFLSLTRTWLGCVCETNDFGRKGRTGCKWMQVQVDYEKNYFTITVAFGHRLKTLEKIIKTSKTLTRKLCYRKDDHAMRQQK